MTAEAVLQIFRLGHPWPTLDPFLVCVHHEDAYPPGNAVFGPAASLAGRTPGSDFAGKDGWRMYHGLTVPGFPAHPHRGFETVTIMKRGFIDHADSLGAAARFGAGDVQWLTAGRGIVHSEMFPLLRSGEPNPLELFQIWLNLPRRSKLVQGHFTMFWSENVPRHSFTDAAGGVTEITCIAGRLPDTYISAPPPPPDSWASAPEAELAIWTLKMSPGARWVLPAAAGADIGRTLYFFKGERMSIDGSPVSGGSAVVLRSAMPVELVSGAEGSELLMLQGRAIGEPVAQRGPFVMNTDQEVMQAYADYNATRFGGWPWPDAAPVHGGSPQRFAQHADGRLEPASKND